ncbi:MAG TPA: hypothetical protein VGQ96_06490 [Candidatus Eremiobacteraceae bacterium]|nr:hypothetical protein [Candidatus Eremiobacteraceae bacterium]
MSVIAALGTFVVIAATAIAAIVQLRHMRSSNQIAILTELREEYADPEFIAAREFVRRLSTELDDPHVRAQLREDPLPIALRQFLRVAYVYENLGCFVKRGILDTDLVCDLWAPVVWGMWRTMAPAIVIARRTKGQSIMENFEYLAFVSNRYLEKHPTSYPRRIPRIAPEDKWLAQDAGVKQI